MANTSEPENEGLKQVLEAADKSPFSNLFNPKELQIDADNLISQRTLKNDEGTVIDIVPSETVQKAITKKMNLLIEEQIEFVKPSNPCEEGSKHKKSKSRVRLLNDFDCFVKPFEEFEYEDPGPRKKPHIERRNVDNDYLDEETKLQAATIDGQYILSLKETESWCHRSKGKVFAYKLGKGINKVHNFIEPVNEFTKTRRKNQWNESKIKTAKFPSKIK